MWAKQWQLLLSKPKEERAGPESGFIQSVLLCISGEVIPQSFTSQVPLWADFLPGSASGRFQILSWRKGEQPEYFCPLNPDTSSSTGASLWSQLPFGSFRSYLMTRCCNISYSPFPLQSGGSGLQLLLICRVTHPLFFGFLAFSFTSKTNSHIKFSIF